jgi:hypothetical protein
VSDGVYQIRGFDMSNMTLVEGDRGVIVIDPLISQEVAAAALALYRERRGDRPVTAVIYTHSHRGPALCGGAGKPRRVRRTRERARHTICINGPKAWNETLAINWLEASDPFQGLQPSGSDRAYEGLVGLLVAAWSQPRLDLPPPGRLKPLATTSAER